jgi:Myosin-crossreactive antigen
MTRKAYMIGTGIGNLAAGIYLIRDGGLMVTKSL